MNNRNTTTVTNKHIVASVVSTTVANKETKVDGATGNVEKFGDSSNVSSWLDK